MKNLFLILIAIIAIFSCKDDKIEPTNTIKADVLIGTWVSVDSTIAKFDDSTFEYVHDYLEFSKDTLVFNNPKKFKKSSAYTVYTYELFSLDSINLKYIGPTEIGIINNNWLHKITISGDTLQLIDMKKTYPYSHFNKFVKIR